MLEWTPQTVAQRPLLSSSKSIIDLLIVFKHEIESKYAVKKVLKWIIIVKHNAYNIAKAKNVTKSYMSFKVLVKSVSNSVFVSRA